MTQRSRFLASFFLIGEGLDPVGRRFFYLFAGGQVKKSEQIRKPCYLRHNLGGGWACGVIG